MSVVADSSPLVILGKLGCFDLLSRLFPRVYISTEVHHEVVVAGAGLPGSFEVSKAEWIEVKAVPNPAGLDSAQRKFGLGPGEMSTILLAKELHANPVLLDDYRARKVAKAEDRRVMGSIGLLEAFYLRGYLADLRSVFQELVTHNVTSISGCWTVGCERWACPHSRPGLQRKGQRKGKDRVERKERVWLRREDSA